MYYGLIVRRAWIAKWKEDNMNGGRVTRIKEVAAKGRRGAAKNYGGYSYETLIKVRERHSKECYKYIQVLMAHIS